jgi:uncharacterized protein YwgA
MTGDEGAVRARGKSIVKALRRLGDETDRPVKMGSKDDRIRLQKLVYLLRAGGYEPARKFEFNLYQNGPYSPALTEVYYLYGDDGIGKAAPATDIPSHLLSALKEADRKGVEFLEALSTTLDTTNSLAAHGEVVQNMDRGLAWAQSIKPHIDEKTWREVRGFLRTHPGLAARG